jgi:hypothetical protein
MDLQPVTRGRWLEIHRLYTVEISEYFMQLRIPLTVIFPYAARE